MKRLHGTALWTNVLFCLAVSIACCARQFRSDIEPYERVLIRRIAGLTQFSALLALSGYVETLGRRRLLWCCLVIIVTTGAAAEGAAAMPAHRTTDSLLQACRDALEPKVYPWFGAVALAYITKDRIPYLCLVFGTLGTWTALWAYLRFLFSRDRHKAEPRPATLRCAIIAFFVVTLGVFGFAVYFLAKTIDKHIYLSCAPPTGDDGETQWSVGQIAAPFAWLGLTVDTIYELTRHAAEPETPPISNQILHAMGSLTVLWLLRVAKTLNRAVPASSETLSHTLKPLATHNGPAMGENNGPEE
jgi:hypothetical protein